MHKTGYLGVLSPDLFNYCKRFVFKRLFPPNLAGPPTLFLEDDIIDIKSFSDHLYVVHLHDVQCLSTGKYVAIIHEPSVEDVGFTTDGTPIVLTAHYNVVALNSFPLSFGCRNMVVDRNRIYLLSCHGMLHAYTLHQGRLVDVVWHEKAPTVKKIVNYDAPRLLCILNYGAFALVNKQDGSVDAQVPSPDMCDAVVDDEGKILFKHVDYWWFSLWDAELRCIKKWEMPWISKICLHNHSLLFVADNKQVLVVQ